MYLYVPCLSQVETDFPFHIFSYIVSVVGNKPVTQLRSDLTAKCHSSFVHFLFPFVYMLIANINVFRITQHTFVQN